MYICIYVCMNLCIYICLTVCLYVLIAIAINFALNKNKQSETSYLSVRLFENIDKSTDDNLLINSFSVLYYKQNYH